jgi:clan AA aspartic protease (TIGR02281 family)
MLRRPAVALRDAIAIFGFLAAGMNRSFKVAVAALVLAVSFAGSAAAGPVDEAERAAAAQLIEAATGTRNKQDWATGVTWFRKAAEGGDVQAQSYLGFLYFSQQPTEARKWLRKAAEQGDVQAQYNLGQLYEEGWGGQKDYAAALKWYRKAAEQGYASAQYALGQMYESGQGVQQDYAAAVNWYRKAAEQGHGLAQSHAQWLTTNAAPKQATQGRVPLKMDGGTFVVPVQINGTMTLDFVIDSGAADVSVPADVVSTLMRVGAIRGPDFIGENTYVLADGSKTKSPTFTIRTLKVGNTVLENVRGSVASSQGSLLLGQSFLSRFKSWSIDNNKQELLLEPR